MQKKIDILMIFMLIFSFFTLLAGDAVETNSKYISSANSNTNMEIATWDFKLNGTTNASIDIDLKDTIDQTNPYSTTNIIPGTTGMIALNINCENVKVALDYAINLTKISVPTNLKFYQDNTYTTEFTTLNSFVALDSTKNITHNIYWKWDFTEDNETTDWANKNVNIKIDVTADQRVAGVTS